ncbi:hypothetical protein Tco_1218244 [Tanacetum coccineum]
MMHFGPSEQTYKTPLGCTALQACVWKGILPSSIELEPQAYWALKQQTIDPCMEYGNFASMKQASLRLDLGFLALCRDISLEKGSGYHQKDRKPSQNDKTEHGMEKTVQNQGQSPKMPKSESKQKNQQSNRSRN